MMGIRRGMYTFSQITTTIFVVYVQISKKYLSFINYFTTLAKTLKSNFLASIFYDKRGEVLHYEADENNCFPCGLDFFCKFYFISLF